MNVDRALRTEKCDNISLHVLGESEMFDSCKNDMP